jgi:hypothetical protein
MISGRGRLPAGAVEAIDRSLDLVAPSDDREKLASEGGPEVVHCDDVAWVCDRNDGCPESPTHRDGMMSPCDPLRNDRFRARRECGVGQVDEPEVVNFRKTAGCCRRSVCHPA